MTIPSMATDRSHLQPLLPKTTKDYSQAVGMSISCILLRLCSVILVLAITLWANIEASRGFPIFIINDAKDSPLGKRFALFFQSDDTATRILLNTSSFVDKFLYAGVPHCDRKPVTHLTVRFSGNNSVDGNRWVPVSAGASNGEFVISLGLSLMEDRDFGRQRVTHVLQSSMVKIWLWGEEARAPPQLVNGMTEYIAGVGGFGGEDLSQPSVQLEQIIEEPHGCWADKADAKLVAKFLGYCDGKSKGFIQRLNQAMKQPWDDRSVDIAFGARSGGACGSYRDMLRELKTQQDNKNAT